MNSLLSRLVDSSHVVRKFCIRGLGNISSVEDSQVGNETSSDPPYLGLGLYEDPNLVTYFSPSVRIFVGFYQRWHINYAKSSVEFEVGWKLRRIYTDFRVSVSEFRCVSLSWVMGNRERSEPKPSYGEIPLPSNIRYPEEEQ